LPSAPKILTYASNDNTIPKIYITSDRISLPRIGRNATTRSSITPHQTNTQNRKQHRNRKPKKMTSSQQPSTTSTRSTRFMQGASHVNDPEGKLWWPARWIVQLIQYLIALVMLTLAEGFRSVFSGEKPSGRRRGGKVH
jgi:hypothetical protein